MMPTDATNHQPLQESKTLPTRSWLLFRSPAEIPGGASQSFLVEEILFPGNICRIDLLLELDPLFSWLAPWHGAITDHPARRINRSPAVGKSSSVGRILQHLIDGSLGDCFPEELSLSETGRLVTRKQDPRFPKHAHHLSATPQFVKRAKDQFNGMTDAIIRVFYHTPILKTNQPGWQMLAVLAALHLAQSASV